MGEDHDDAGNDCYSWLLWLENETALSAAVDG